MNVVGIDLALTAIGYACEHGACVLTPPERKLKRGEHRTLNDDLTRLDWIDDAVADQLRRDAPDLAVIEGYSRGSAARREEMGEVGGVIRLRCWNRGIPIALVPPKSLKVFATNDGAADKAKMAVTASRLGWDGDEHDAADGWHLRQMGLYHLGASDVPRTAYRDDAVAKVQWPEVTPGSATP